MELPLRWAHPFRDEEVDMAGKYEPLSVEFRSASGRGQTFIDLEFDDVARMSEGCPRQRGKPASGGPTAATCSRGRGGMRASASNAWSSW